MTDEIALVFERFTDASLSVIRHGERHAQEHGRGKYGTGDLLVGLLSDNAGIAKAAFSLAGLKAKDIIDELHASRAQTLAVISLEVPFTTRCHQSLLGAVLIADELDSQRVQPEHLLLALLVNERGSAHHVLTSLKIDFHQLRQSLMS